MQSIKFSIIIPIYNAEKYIGSCIESIINQKYKNWELILIDDGSQDQSYNICNEYSLKDTRIRLYHIKNSGVSHARNIGIGYVTGEYILFVDADDKVSSNWLLIYSENIMKYHGDLYYQNYKFIYDNQREEQNKHDTSCYKIPIEEFSSFFNDKWILFSATWSKCFKTSIVNNNHIRFDEKLTICEDYLFTVLYLKYAVNIYYISNIGYFYRIVNNSLSRTSKKKINHISRVLDNELFKNASGLILECYKLYIVILLKCDYNLLKRNIRYQILNNMLLHNIMLSDKRFILIKYLKQITTNLLIYDIYILSVNILSRLKSNIKLKKLNRK